MPEEPDVMQLELPIARTSDPPASHIAAQTVSACNSDLVMAIRRAVRAMGSGTHYEIADSVNERWPSRWSEATIRTACARANLEQCEWMGRSPRGRLCHVWRLSDDRMTVSVDRAVL